MIDIIKRAAIEAMQSTGPVNIMEAVVVSPPPNVSIRLINNPKMVIPKQLIVVSEYLTRHKRSFSISSSNVEDIMTEAGMGPHAHDITSLNIAGQIEFTDELKTGDKVMVANLSGGQKYYVFDRIKSY